LSNNLICSLAFFDRIYRHIPIKINKVIDKYIFLWCIPLFAARHGSVKCIPPFGAKQKLCKQIPAARRYTRQQKNYWVRHFSGPCLIKEEYVGLRITQRC
jgi:hypothetical protein